MCCTQQRAIRYNAFAVREKRIATTTRDDYLRIKRKVLVQIKPTHST